ncbi:putative amino acid transporter [Diaporthe ampelina]|uniref:Putative amino acid transporter n=1 Tax=Diaporthe ampelina TaxID=1214573 RepID=A0A0G2G0L0_9PEZI|nr:putative amino acid transporter [Diaporthe ampelina]
MTKQELRTTEDVGVDTDQDATGIVTEIYRGTSADQHDMDVLGVKQVLRRNYRLVPMLGFSSIAVISWEIAPILLGYALVDGGPAAVFWGSAVVMNTVLASRLPVVQYLLFALHFGGIFAIVIPLWLTADRGNPSDVLLKFSDNGNWGNVGLSSMIGLTVFVGLLNGYDCIAHMSEETVDASRIIPIAITWSVAYNVVTLFIIGTALIFCLGNVESLLNTRTGQPSIQLFYNATQSYAGSSVMAAILVILVECCVINEVATSSRQLWSFARDRGLPGSTWLSYVAPGWDIPLRAICLTVLITALLSLINLGSTVALNATNSLGGVAFLFSYAITLVCLIWRRTRGAPLPPRRWSLGRYGLAINIMALAFLIPILFFYCWPLAQPVTATNLNWSSVALCCVLLAALIYYVIKARHEYVGPVMRVKRA